MSVPPATQKPCTLQTTGLSEWNRLMNPRTLRLMPCQSSTGSQTSPGSWFGMPCSANSLRSYPPQKPLPLPDSAITWISGSRFARSTASASSRGVSSVIALARSGRSRVMRATRPSAA